MKYSVFVSSFLGLLVLGLSAYILFINYGNNRLFDYGIVLFVFILYIPSLIYDMKLYTKNNQYQDNMLKMTTTKKESHWPLNIFTLTVPICGLVLGAFKSTFYTLTYLQRPNLHLLGLILIFLGLFLTSAIMIRRLYW